MPMRMPKPEADAVELFESLLARDPRLVPRKMFGQPAAFVQGNLCLGVFGADVFVRLDEEDRSAVARVRGSRNFEPMPGRPMRDYWILPPSALRPGSKGTDWVARSIAATLRRPSK